MIRDLMESGLPSAAQGLIMTASTLGPGRMVFEFWFVLQTNYLAPLIAVIVGIYYWLPKTHAGRASLPAMVLSAHEYMDFSYCRLLVTNLFMVHLGYNTTFLAAAISFFHVGGLCGGVFYGVIAGKSRKVSMLISMVFGMVILIVFSTWSSRVMTKHMRLSERDFFTDNNSGSRKIRLFLDPNLAKGLTNEFGFEGAFPNVFQHTILLLIFAGFCMTPLGAVQSTLSDVWGHEVMSRNANFIAGLLYWKVGTENGLILGTIAYIFLDIPAAFAFGCAYKAICSIVVLTNAETKGWERATEVTGSPCFLKGTFYSMFLWPQGNGHAIDMLAFMWNERQHWRSSDAGYVGARTTYERVLFFYLWSHFLRLLYIPTIGGMFFAIFATPNPLMWSLFMEFFCLWRCIEGWENYWVYISIYPAFVNQYMATASQPLFLGICAGMRHLGHFLAIGRWPTQMLCGDPMNCWRSQYLYSHALFYNCGGDMGNINYVTWYCFSKSQRRQCCCPYRKLKADAPEKCCPPCCLGPMVEETGGCPCPCCCASCSA